MTATEISLAEEGSTFAPVTEVVCELGESPVWDDRRQCLFWCDIEAGLIWQMQGTGGETRSWTLPGRVGSIGLCESGRIIAGCEMEILLLDPETGAITPVTGLPASTEPMRLNDGRIGADGAFWVGTMHEVPRDRMDPIAGLWRVTAQGADLVVEGLKCSNGLAFSSDGRVMMHSDSAGQWVSRHSFDPETGTMGPGEVICRPGEADGRPDGGAMDSAGIYWSAGVSAGVINGYAADGQRLCQMRVPAPHPTMPCFGGPDFRTLFLTSFRKGMSEDDLALAPLSGRLFSLRTRVAGFAAPRFDDSALA